MGDVMEFVKNKTGIYYNEVKDEENKGILLLDTVEENRLYLSAW